MSDYCTLPRKTVHKIKNKFPNAVPLIPEEKKRRESIAVTSYTTSLRSSTPNNTDSLPRRIIKKVRKSMAGGEPALRHRTDEERAAHEALEVKITPGIDDFAYDPSKPSMRDMSVGNRPEVRAYYNLQGRNRDKMSLGGMIILHQYCYKMYEMTRDPVYRDGANFFKDADWEHFSINDRIPVRLVYLNYYSCERVEPWYRDHYTNREQTRFNSEIFSRDRLTNSDKFFDNLGREAFSMMTKEMHLLENYCLFQLEVTKNAEYEKGIVFWQKASPLGFPRNYQLALMYAKKEKWEHKEMDKWFKMLYTSQCYKGARGFDFFPPVQQSHRRSSRYH